LKTIEDTPTTLVLRRIPIALWLFGLVFVAVGLGVGLLVGKVAVLQCQRTGSGGECQFSTHNLIGTSNLMTFPVTDLQGARLRISEDSDGDETYRVEFQVKEEWIPLAQVYSSGYTKKDVAVRSINTFITNRGQSGLTIRQDDRFFAMLFGGIFITVGLVTMFILGQITTLRLDRSTGLITLKRVGLLGTREGEYLLSDFNDSVVEYNDNTSRIAMVNRAGEHLPLTSVYTSGSRSKEATAKKIREFLRPGGLDTNSRSEWEK
jgi:hypothetical protein